MTQQQIVKLLDLNFKRLGKSRVRLYALLENIDYKEAKIKLSI